MKVELTGRIPSKKNSRRHFVVGGRRIVAPSKAYETWHQEWMLRLSAKRPTVPLDGPLGIKCVFYLKGKLDADLDNMMASVADLLEDAGYIANDKLIVHADLTKWSLAPDFRTEVSIYPYTPQESPSPKAEAC